MQSCIIPESVSVIGGHLCLHEKNCIYKLTNFQIFNRFLHYCLLFSLDCLLFFMTALYSLITVLISFLSGKTSVFIGNWLRYLPFSELEAALKNSNRFIRVIRHSVPTANSPQPCCHVTPLLGWHGSFGTFLRSSFLISKLNFSRKRSTAKMLVISIYKRLFKNISEIFSRLARMDL